MYACPIYVIILLTYLPTEAVVIQEICILLLSYKTYKPYMLEVICFTRDS